MLCSLSCSTHSLPSTLFDALSRFTLLCTVRSAANYTYTIGRRIGDTMRNFWHFLMRIKRDSKRASNWTSNNLMKKYRIPSPPAQLESKFSFIISIPLVWTKQSEKFSRVYVFQNVWMLSHNEFHSISLPLFLPLSYSPMRNLSCYWKLNVATTHIFISNNPIMRTSNYMSVLLFLSTIESCAETKFGLLERRCKRNSVRRDEFKFELGNKLNWSCECSKCTTRKHPLSLSISNRRRCVSSLRIRIRLQLCHTIRAKLNEHSHCIMH